MSNPEITVNVDEYLALDKYEVDEDNAHIELVADPCDEEGRKSFDYAGCLECGTCRIACGDTIVEKWEFPGPTMGVEYRFG